MALQFHFILILLFLLKLGSAIQLKLENSTEANFDLVSGLQKALTAEQEQLPTKTLQNQPGGIAIAEKDVAKIKMILKSLNEPTGRLGQRCSYQDWTKYMKPAISRVIEGKKVLAAEAYKEFARAAISNPDLIQRVCLSKFIALQCEPVVERCECLYLEELKVENVECSGIRTKFYFGFVLIPVISYILVI